MLGCSLSMGCVLQRHWWRDEMSKPRKSGLIPSLPRSWLCFVNMPLSAQMRKILLQRALGSLFWSHLKFWSPYTTFWGFLCHLGSAATSSLKQFCRIIHAWICEQSRMTYLSSRGSKLCLPLLVTWSSEFKVMSFVSSKCFDFFCTWFTCNFCGFAFSVMCLTLNLD